jgi:rRNA-processing protein FCF1
VTGPPREPLLVLDAGALLALARGDVVARAAVKRAVRQGYRTVVPTPVVAKVHRASRHRAAMDRALQAVDSFAETSLETAKRAGCLLGLASMADAIDAIVVAEAIRSERSTIATSDADDIGRLVDAGEAGRTVYVEAV